MSRRTIAIIASLIVLPFAFERPFAVAGTPEIFKDTLSWLNYADFWLLNAGIHPSALAVGATILLVGWLVPDGWSLFIKSNRNRSRASALLRRAGRVVNNERVEQPNEVAPAIRRAQEVIANGQPALLEIITSEEHAFPFRGAVGGAR